jgi:hypothetical protein
MRKGEALPEDDVDLHCATDLRPVPPARRMRRAIYCSEACRREAANWRRREARALRGKV